MRSFAHLAAKDDPFRRKALSALWEWDEAAKSEGRKKGNAGPKAEAEVARAKDVAPRNPSASKPEPAPLLAIAQKPEALTPPKEMISIVNVWASWCAPCRAEMPSLQAFAAALDPARYRLVGLNTDRDRDFAREFMRDFGITFGNFWDGKGAFARKRFRVNSYPQTLFLDSSGVVLARVIGSREWPADAAEATLAEILAAGRQKKGTE